MLIILQTIRILAIAALSLLSTNYAESAQTPPSELQSLDTRLLTIQDELLKDQSTAVDQFLADAIRANFGPAYYIRAIRNDNQTESKRRQFAVDIVQAQAENIYNASLFVVEAAKWLPWRDEVKDSLLRKALFTLAVYGGAESYIVAQTKYRLFKRLTRHPIDAYSMRREILKSVALGSPLSNAWLVRNSVSTHPLVTF